MFWGVMTRLQVTGNGGVFMRANNIPLAYLSGYNASNSWHGVDNNNATNSWNGVDNIVEKQAWQGIKWGVSLFS